MKLAAKLFVIPAQAVIQCPSNKLNFRFHGNDTAEPTPRFAKEK